MPESVPKLPTPTHPEGYTEVVKTDIQEKNGVVCFEFQFARPVDGEKVQAMWDDTGRTVQKTIEDTLTAKGWKSDEDVDWSAETNEDGKTWTFYYQKKKARASSAKR